MERTDGVEQQQAWGRLVRVGASAESALSLLLVNKECTVGRRKGECVIVMVTVTLIIYHTALLP